MRYFFSFVAVAVIVVSASTTRADEKTHRAAAEKVLTVSKTEETMKKSIDSMLDLQIKQQPVLKPLRPAMQKFFDKYLSYADIKDELVDLYVAEFTEEELNELAAFYQTPLGKKSVEKLPVLTAKGAEIGMRRVQENQAELQKMIREELSKPKPPAPAE